MSNSHIILSRVSLAITEAAAMETRKASPVQRVVNQNAELLDNLHGRVSTLGAHLAPVSRRNDTVSGDNKLAADSEFLGNSELIEQLLGQQRQIERLLAAVRDIEAGLEV